MRPARALHVGLAAALTLAGAACEDDDAAPPTGCAGLVQAADDAVEIDDQIDLLDRALTVCRSYDDFAEQLDAVPGLVGYDTRSFVKLRCDERSDIARTRTPACSAVPPPSTTTPVDTTVADLVYVGITLDGRRIEIRPSSDVPFVGDRPEVVKLNTDIAEEAGCDGVLEQRTFWTARARDLLLPADERDIASVFARHAWVVAAFIGCEVGEPPTARDAAPASP